MHKDFKKQTCRRQSDHFIYLTPALSVLFFSIIACSVLVTLVFYYNDMLGKGNDAKNPAFFAFVCYRKNPTKNPVKCNACAVAREIATDCFSRNVEMMQRTANENAGRKRRITCRFLAIQSFEFQEIWQKNRSETA